ncbi:MAG TPA: ACT domain-containing protein [Thermoplasmata archaeon]|nr:ACT domain-containing protein [Thermoplasmata archaeon]
MPIQELSLRLPNSPGQLAEILRRLSQERINIAAVSVDSTRSQGHVRLVVSDPVRALEVMRDAELPVETRELITIALEDKPGSLLQALDLLAKGRVNILSITLLVTREHARVLVALSVNNMPKARRLLTEKGYLSHDGAGSLTNADLLGVSPAISSESVGMLL